MLIGTAVAIVGPYGACRVYVPKSDVIPHDKFNAHVAVDAKYLGLPLGAKVRITLELITDEEQT